jgi:crotonobetainyl-CoA:carnitine CoA-transferase CaiB-like acyl-CoA transferase
MNALSTTNFFEGLKIIELSNILAGPSVGMFFAEMGAKVLKVENKATKGDITRSWKLPAEPVDTDYSAYYCSVNWQKEVLMLDLKSSEDLELLYTEIKTADIVITNFKTTSAKAIGVSNEQLQAINPKLIIAHLKGFPDSDRPAFDIVLQAETGFLYMNGAPNQPPVKMPVALIDVLAAHQLKEAILVALLHQARTGNGSIVTASLYEAAIASLVNQATNWLMAHHIPQPMGTQHPNIAPYGDLFYTKDRQLLVLAIGTERQFEGLCKCLGIEELITDERFETNTVRVKNRIVLMEVLEPLFKKNDCSVIYNQLLKANIPVGKVNNMKAVFENENAQKMILNEVFEDGRNTQRVKTVAFQIE